MSGHSKWNNIKRKKEAADAKKGAIFTKIGREIAVAVREGGADPDSNRKLKDLIAKAKSNNMPNDNIQRSIQRAAGGQDGANFEEITYEGYGPSGTAILVRCLSDNRNRTAGDVRHLFDRRGGNLGTTGCVSFMFNARSRIYVVADEADEDQLMMDALEAGAEDVKNDGENEDGETIFEIDAAPDVFTELRDALEAASYQIIEAEVVQVPDTYVQVDEESRLKIESLIESLEDHDDVQAVYHNMDEAD
ncbi:MAG: YebC/PmpR family DNA-binding transcriptional regulator [Eubacteriales bacterium]|nr:YebC/PmpR family DNA-binding transcriptional regulator [Eubacteriales bacterium]